jgi:hypothetical protein
MTANKNDALILKIADKLRLIAAHQLQALAEDMAVLACPDRYYGRTLIRQGRNTLAQTTKGWPDAYVSTGTNIVDGIEATRDQNKWEKHLRDDLEKANDPKHPNLSGYFFVGGNPKDEPEAQTVANWMNAFISYGIPASNIQLLIGKHLAIELADPKYARVRQNYLGIPSQGTYFEGSDQAWTAAREEGLFHPSKSDFLSGFVYQPAITTAVINQLLSEGEAYVIGNGACGKTTLAQSISLDPRFSLSPVYVLDLARLSPAATSGELMNEMLELSGKRVLFVIDNTHVDERRAEVLLTYWKEFCRPSDVSLLLMGRRTRAGKAPQIGHLSPKKLEVSESDLEGIVECLFRHHKKNFTGVSKEALQLWIATFGGNHLQTSEKGVDLVAFSAAVSQRSAELLSGDWRLSEDDTFQALRKRYLEKINSVEDRANLIRMAALAEYEIPIPLAALPYPATGIGRLRELGLVLEYQQNLSMVHAALGNLLLKAAEFHDITAERHAAARVAPALCARMILRSSNEEEKQHLQAILSAALDAADWLKGCSGLPDVGTALSVGLRARDTAVAVVANQLQGNQRLIHLVKTTRSLEAITFFSKRLQLLGLTGIAAEVLSVSPKDRWQALEPTFLRASASETIGFLKTVSDPNQLLKQISLDNWSETRGAARFEIASATSQLCRYLESVNARELATAPANSFIEHLKDGTLHNSDLGDISNVVRYADASELNLLRFFDKLKASGWLAATFMNTRQGQLCGALMSFNNTLSPAVRQAIFIPALQERIDKELKDLGGHDHALVARAVCLLGAAAALCPPGLTLVCNWRWPQGLSIAEVYNSRAPKSGTPEIGMYELQFWSGLRWLATQKVNVPKTVVPAFGDAFLARLRNAKAPTLMGREYKDQLILWSEACQQRGWLL